MNSASKELVYGLECDMLKPDVRGSAERLSVLLADDFVEIGESGRRYSKEDVLLSLPTLIAAEYVVHDFEAREIGKDTILVHYRLEMKRGQNGRPTYSLRSSIWQQRPPGWQVIFHQGTPQS